LTTQGVDITSGVSVITTGVLEICLVIAAGIVTITTVDFAIKTGRCLFKNVSGLLIVAAIVLVIATAAVLIAAVVVVITTRVLAIAMRI